MRANQKLLLSRAFSCSGPAEHRTIDWYLGVPIQLSGNKCRFSVVFCIRWKFSFGPVLEKTTVDVFFFFKLLTSRDLM